MIENLRIIAVLAVLGTLAAPAVAGAAEATLLGTFGAWKAYEAAEGDGKICYMAAEPQKMEGNYSKRGDVFAYLTHRPGEDSRGVFSYITGYSYKPDSAVKVKIGDQTFNLFTSDETAWAPDASVDAKIAEAIRKGSTMVVTGTSVRGTATKDTFSLKGSGSAQDAISKACGL